MSERITFQSFIDSRGTLLVGVPPFIPKRFFIIKDAPGEVIRGGHAHKTLHEFFICLRGSVSVYTDDGKNVRGCTLSNSTFGLHVPPLTWVEARMQKDSELLVLASELYDPSDYVTERHLL